MVLKATNGVDLTDDDVWDDSYLINTWDEAVAEYEKYHSIQQSGRRIEDILSKEEVKLLREDSNGGRRQLPQDDDHLIDVIGDQSTKESEHTPVLEIANIEETREDLEEAPQEQPPTGDSPLARPSEHEAAVGPTAAPAAPLPHALLDTVQDENMKNIMMSWYYAGYYTGIHVGRQGPHKPEDAPR